MLVRKIKNVATDTKMYISIDKLIKTGKLPLGYEFTPCDIWFDDYLLNDREKRNIIL